jgi:hypothetical protein
MAKAEWCGEQVYAAARGFAEDCLHRDGSLFSPNMTLWTRDNAGALQDAIGGEDLSQGTFIGKLLDHLSGASPEVIQMAAELIYVLLLAEADTGGPKRREHVTAILELLSDPPTIPAPLDAAFDGGGVAGFGQAKTRRDAHMRFLLRLVRAVKELPASERTSVLSDPWRFHEHVATERTSTDAMEANAIVHLLFPDTFEYMVSEGHRRKLIEAFAAAPGIAEAADADRKIQLIRELATEGDGARSALNLYADPFKRVWDQPASTRWQEAVRWGRALYSHSTFDVDERTYKLQAAELVSQAKEALAGGATDWLDLLEDAFKKPLPSMGQPQNLVGWRVRDKFLVWCRENPDQAGAVLSNLWADVDDATMPELAAFFAALPTEAVRGAGTRVSVASFLLMGVEAGRFPFFKPTVYDDVRKLLGIAGAPVGEVDPEQLERPEALAARLGLDARRVREFLRATYPRESEDRGISWYLTAEQVERVVQEFTAEVNPAAEQAVYGEWVRLMEELRLRLLAAGTEICDLVDAQGIAWWLARSPAPADWPPEERTAFEAFQKGGAAAPAPGDELPPAAPVAAAATLPPATPELAGKLYVPQSWLQRLIDLLAEKRQIILYGPPGTGKTFIAQHLGDHLVADRGMARLVQFHPSYTYEDFFEGYRPQHHTGGALSFELVPGTLRELAREAATHPDRPHVLIIDEINRGNIAKIFGELYFLLEYRDRGMQLQYSRGETFKLPDNLYIIGTMNTADRSIALVDSALRRRFYFVGLMPTREPIDRVLAEWLSDHGLDPGPAELLAELNRAIDDEEFSIGPSYFITRDGSAPDVERVWRYSIMPLLEEHYHGTDRNIEAEFGLSRLGQRLAAEADRETMPDDGD